MAPPIASQPLRVKIVTKTGTHEVERVIDARVRAESWIESATTAVHTLMYADGGYVVWTYTRGSEGTWVRDTSIAGTSDGAQRPVHA